MKYNSIRPFATVCLMSPRETAPFRAVALDRIQDFTTWAPILNFIRKMAGKERFSGKSRRESRRIFNDKRQAAVWSVRHSA